MANQKQDLQIALAIAETERKFIGTVGQLAQLIRHELKTHDTELIKQNLELIKLTVQIETQAAQIAALSAQIAKQN